MHLPKESSVRSPGAPVASEVSIGLPQRTESDNPGIGLGGGTSAPTPTPESLWPQYYEELHSVAVAVLRGEPPSPSLQATLVLHEAWMKVFGGREPEWRGRAYFIASHARAMRQYLIDRGRRRKVERSALSIVPIRDAEELSLAEVGRSPERAQALNEAIDELAHAYPRAASVVEMRCAFDFSNEQLAELLGVAVRTVKQDWTFARAWLYQRLESHA